MAFLGKNDKKIYNDVVFEAWDYGPVIKPLYQKLKTYGNDPINSLIFVDTPEIDESCNEASEIKLGCSKLLKMKAYELVQFTHDDNSAWQKNYSSDNNTIIKDQDIKDEYKKRMNYINNQEC